MFRVDVAEALREHGYDVVRASETGQARAEDRQILEKAIADERILVTLDEHFGNWAILPLFRHPGVIRLKVHPTTSKKVKEVLIPFLKKHDAGQFKDHLVILSAKRAKWVLTGI
jgi:predicted nuclease of predicted toxin-antitoxin system